MVRWIIPAALMIFCNFAYSQQSLIDSLQKRLSSSLKKDSFRLNLLIELAGLSFSSDPEAGLKFSNEAIELARNLQQTNKLAEALTNKGNNYWAKGEDKEAAKTYKEALEQYSIVANDYGQAKIYNNLGLLSFNSSAYGDALQYHTDALKIFQKLNHTKGIANSYNNAGVVLQYLGDYPAAVDYYLKTIRIYEGSADSAGTGIANAYSNVGIIYKNLREFEKALLYQNEALRLYHKSNNKQGVANVLGNIGNLYDLLNKYDSSINFYKKALSRNEEIGNSRRIASDLANIGNAFGSRNNYAAAITFMERARVLYTELEDKNSLSTVLAQLAWIYTKASGNVLSEMNINPNTKKKLISGYFQKAIELASSIGAVDRQSEIYALMSNSYEFSGDYIKALEAFKKHTVLRDSISNDSKRKEIVRKELQFGFEKKEALLRNEMETQKLISTADINTQKLKLHIGIAAIGVLLILGSVIGFLYKKRRDAEEKSKEVLLKAQIAETEMKALRSQMNPHFLYNSLNSINDYIDKQQIGTATSYISKFATLMRMILEHSEKKEIVLSDDLEALELYMQLEAQRLNHTFSYEIKIGEGIDRESTLIPPMILQPFVENSIWHGLSKMKRQGKITIGIEKRNEFLHCTVEDNGVGRVSKPQSYALPGKQNSLGLKITQSRIDIINRVKNTTAAFTLNDLEEGLRVELNLPYESDL